MKYLMSAEWWKAAGIRAVKTMCQTGAALVVTQLPGGSVDLVAIGSAAIVAGVASLGTSLAGLPKVTDNVRDSGQTFVFGRSNAGMRFFIYPAWALMD